MAKYTNESQNEIHGQKGSAMPGDTVELTDREFEVLTEAGYKLTLVAPPKKAAPAKEGPKPSP